jgi:hypothetical protein
MTAREDSIAKSVGFKLRAARLRAKEKNPSLTATKVDRLCNWGAGMCSKYENGRYEPSLTRLYQLAVLYEVRVSSLFENIFENK